MKDLYVIGNGFDIHHRIPSSYKNFRTWLEENDPDMLSRMDEVLELCTDEWWNEFETNLGEVSAVRFFTENAASENEPVIMSEDFRSGELDNARYEIEDRLGGLIADLKAEFQLWASQLPPGDDGEVVLVNSKEAFFLTFNYSLTLEKLYGIRPEIILHIHGSALDKDSIVVGHGRSYSVIRDELDDPLPEPPDDVPAEEYEKWFQEVAATNADDYSTKQAKDAAASALYSIHKDVAGIIAHNSAFFQSLKDVERIHIYGLSFADTDLPYLDAIFGSVNLSNVDVEISWFSDKDKNRIEDFLSTVPQPKSVNLMRLSDIRRYYHGSLF